MAQVDFTNARITPIGKNPTERAHVSLMGLDNFRDANGIAVTNNLNNSIITSTRKVLIVQFQGTFTTSGTEFYIWTTNTGVPNSYHYRISNISFASGDSYNFKIRVDLICQ